MILKTVLFVSRSFLELCILTFQTTTENVFIFLQATIKTDIFPNCSLLQVI